VDLVLTGPKGRFWRKAAVRGKAVSAKCLWVTAFEWFVRRSYEKRFGTCRVAPGAVGGDRLHRARIAVASDAGFDPRSEDRSQQNPTNGPKGDQAAAGLDPQSPHRNNRPEHG
jgi:hypothetical protein